MGVSTKAVLETGKGKGSDMDGNPVRFVTVGTVVPPYAGAHAEYTVETDWLGRENRTVAPMDGRVLESVWLRYPRTKLSLVGLLGTPHC